MRRLLVPTSRHWIWMIVVCLVLAGCQPPDDTATNTATPLPIEPITVYIGVLDAPTPQTTEDLIALLVSETRVRALLCSLDAQRWQTLDTWFGQGERQASSLTASSTTRNANLTATFASQDMISGDVRITDGVTYHFQASQVATTDDYVAGKAEMVGVYTVSQEPLPDGRLAVFYAVAAPAQERYCGMLLSDDQPVTRVQLNGPWQASFSVFDLPDPIGADKQILVWNTPRHIQRIEGILLPKP